MKSDGLNTLKYSLLDTAIYPLYTHVKVEVDPAVVWLKKRWPIVNLLKNDCGNTCGELTGERNMKDDNYNLYAKLEYQ
jgi:hypothetical protein